MPYTHTHVHMSLSSLRGYWPLDGAPWRINVIWINSSYWFSRFCAYTVKKIKCDWIKLNWMFNPREQSPYVYVINNFYIYIFFCINIFVSAFYIFLWIFNPREQSVYIRWEEFQQFLFRILFFMISYFSLFFILWWDFEMLLLESLDHTWKKK